MTVEDIKSVALSLFAENSYEGTTLSEIAKRVGIKKPSIYAHFDGKEDLFLSVFQDVMKDYVGYIEQHLKKIENYSVKDKLHAMLSDTCRYYMDNEENAAFLKRAMMFPPVFFEEQLREEFLAYEQETTKMLRKIFREGIETGTIRDENIEDLIAAYYCQIDGLFMQMFYYSRENFDSKFNSVWNIFWSGIQR
jgi:AcrR family transcriptional regulator